MMFPVVKTSRHSDETPPTASSCGMFFLTDKAVDALHEFQYAGEDHSLLYFYVFSPLAAFLVNRVTPQSLAPNTITLAGLSFMITSYCIFWYYSPLLEPNPIAPRWIYLFHCASLIVYQVLDNMDGKQARRTNSSSPLGLLFDHGCDAVNSILGSTNWILSIGLSLNDDPFQCFVMVVGPMALFYISTWEEYYTGKLVLPIINGPNEGLVLGALTSLATAMWGVEFWQSTSWYDNFLKHCMPCSTARFLPQQGLRNSDIQVFLACIGFVQETMVKSISVAHSYGRHTLWNLTPFRVLCAGFLEIGIVRPDVWIRKPRTSLLLCSGLFVEQSTQLMLDHVTVQTFRPFRRWVLAPLIVLCLLVSVGHVDASELTDDVLATYTSALWAFLLVKMTIVIHELCWALNINCFDISASQPRGMHIL